MEGEEWLAWQSEALVHYKELTEKREASPLFPQFIASRGEKSWIFNKSSITQVEIEEESAGEAERGQRD